MTHPLPPHGLAPRRQRRVPTAALAGLLLSLLLPTHAVAGQTHSYSLPQQDSLPSG
ncbi:MAG: hypothetical protein LPK18_00795 [Pseudomonadaceae bacterium]|nr:hypothetical protein [Pseudomonadaceae bacterium]